ncbi:hypothetical protein K3169_20240 [Pseudomonas phytophila]|uniref:Cell division protein ZapA n=1 Tax=Pseudomonas phytophila TaxID=2867264 RepID=A0ABY6F9Z0_9PSED|nr:MULTISPECIES: hypothetical protein [Pseudomonas]MCQ2997395.1 hypothetical protein [Pseudomonas syringae]MCD5989234.1 hypothetical protein [Pseudomonas quasicaspiana]MCQ3033127.1 hypothetical protein [Pseudomonas syringae]MDG6403347.1 hypothetical protein [Pseudomonas quasicaspiana]UXZ94673.1 hypothetical protein K3169_20240 [Pseudomonas phytophila]
MTQYTPLSQSPNTVLFINPDAPLPDLHHFAVQRLRAVKELMSSLSDAKEPDTASLASAACLLLQDSCDVLEVMEVRLDKLKA